MDVDSDFSDSNESRRLVKSKLKPKMYVYKYNFEWEKEKMFKDWLRKSSKGDRYFFCKVCDNHYTTVGSNQMC